MTTTLRIVLLAAAVLAAAGTVAERDAPQASPICQQAFVPAYFYPGAMWTRAIDSRPPPSIMILDVTSGAGSSPDRNYQAVVRRAEAAGITVMGYSDTSYARRPTEAVRADVRHYRSWYHVTDIFLDEVASGSSGLPYYRRLADYIHRVSPGAMVALNPGTYPDERYMSIGDLIVAFEGSYASYLKLRVPGWAAAYPARKFVHVIYAAPGADLASAMTLAQRRQADYVYVTGGTGPNPYGSLPAYWSSEDAIIATGCAAA